jgi:hypothetical protein
VRAATSPGDLLEKTVWLSARAGTLGVFADVFNVCNQGVELTVNNGSGPNLGVSQQLVGPLRAGLRVLF